MGFFLPSRLRLDAVSSYLAFSPLPALFSKNRRYHFCDTFRQRSLSRTPPAYSTRHAAVWCSDFPLVGLTTHQRSSAINPSLAQSRTHETGNSTADHADDANEGKADPLSTPKDAKRCSGACVKRLVQAPLHRSLVRRALFLPCRVASIDRFKPIRQKKFLFRWQKCFRRSNDWSQRRRHLKTDEDENDAP